MSRQVIVTGDTLTPCGGEVITGSDTDNIDGKKIARKDDLVNCKEHGINPIAEGDDSTLIEGKPIAFERHHASCGCQLVRGKSECVEDFP